MHLELQSVVAVFELQSVLEEHVRRGDEMTYQCIDEGANCKGMFYIAHVRIGEVQKTSIWCQGIWEVESDRSPRDGNVTVGHTCNSRSRRDGEGPRWR